jgi:hypothetical protein
MVFCLLPCSLADFRFLFLFCCEEFFGDGNLLMSFPPPHHHFFAGHLALLFQGPKK